jgi:hypothetical protein
MGDALLAIAVIAGLIAILMVVLGLMRIAIRGFIVVIVLVVGLSLLGDGFEAVTPEDPPEDPPGTFHVAASKDGGWDVMVPPTPDATQYRVYLEGQRVATLAEPGTVHVNDHAVMVEDYLPGPARRFTLSTVTPQGKQKSTLRWCAPVVFLAARGTWEDKGEASFGHGMGSRGWRTWMKLAQQLGVAPAREFVLPTVVGGTPVVYPATVFSKQSSGYHKSRDKGKRDLTKKINSITKDCPHSRIVLFGYSQGADVVASVWQADTTDPAPFLGVVSFADPYFNRRWTEQMTIYPEGGSWSKDGLLGMRPKFDDSELPNLQVWCLPGDPVCQARPTVKHWHGLEYDCFEDWAAFRLAADVAPFLRSEGWDVLDPRQPRCIPATEKSLDRNQSYEPDPWENVA